MPISDYELADFYSSLTEYGSSDVETAIEKFKEVKLSSRDLAEQIREFAESTGSELDGLDICYVAYDHILQMARNKISEILDFDICNDIKGGTEFYTAGNYMCTSFDYSQEAQEQLEETLREAESEAIEKLLEDDFVRVFLEDVEIDIKEIQKVEIEA